MRLTRQKARHGTKPASGRPREPVEVAGATPGASWLVAQAGPVLSETESSLATESVAASSLSPGSGETYTTTAVRGSEFITDPGG